MIVIKKTKIVHEFVHTKGQLISEWNFGVFKSPKKPTKFHSEIGLHAYLLDTLGLDYIYVAGICNLHFKLGLLGIQENIEIVQTDWM